MSRSRIIAREGGPKKKLAPVTPGEILAEAFLAPMGITKYRLAKEIGVPAQRIGDIVLRSNLSLPILTIEGNTDFKLTQHVKTRLEAFTDMLGQIKAKKSSTGKDAC